MSKFLLHEGFVSELLHSKNLSIKCIIEFFYQTFQYSVQTNCEINRQKAIKFHTYCGELLSSYTLLNALELCYFCIKNCICTQYRDGLAVFRNKLEQIVELREEIESCCIQKLFKKQGTESSLSHIKLMFDFEGKVYTSLKLTPPYRSANVGMSFESLIEFKLMAFRTIYSIQNITGLNVRIPDPKEIFEAFSNLEITSLLNLSLEFLNDCWFDSITDDETFIVAQYKLHLAIHKLYKLKNNRFVVSIA